MASNITFNPSLRRKDPNAPPDPGAGGIAPHTITQAPPDPSTVIAPHSIPQPQMPGAPEPPVASVPMPVGNSTGFSGNTPPPPPVVQGAQLNGPFSTGQPMQPPAPPQTPQAPVPPPAPGAPTAALAPVEPQHAQTQRWRDARAQGQTPAQYNAAQPQNARQQRPPQQVAQRRYFAGGQ